VRDVTRSPNNGLGRPKGAINIATRELKEFWHRFFSSREYRESAKSRILSGSAPHLEGYLFNRIYGKPTETLKLSLETDDREDLSSLSIEELTLRAEELTAQLREAMELKAAIPAEYFEDAENSTKPSVEGRAS
jgi:hypothetical protein